ncbi:hypothetical protein F5883DRAFT_560356 [Diaporthe sp. PMI_573]|nr:hypothetical protein F5883DRAFT_560356 [Diaporthaceae sp. PMI_573]
MMMMSGLRTAVVTFSTCSAVTPAPIASSLSRRAQKRVLPPSPGCVRHPTNPRLRLSAVRLHPALRVRTRTRTRTRRTPKRRPASIYTAGKRAVDGPDPARQRQRQRCLGSQH